MRKAAIYARFSSDRQNESSIEQQVRAVLDYAKRNGFAVVKTYSDSAISGGTYEREGLQELIFDSRKLGFDAVIVWNFDRLARSRKIAMQIRESMKENGIELISITQQIPSGPEGIIVESLYDAMSEVYSWNLARNVMRGMMNSVRNGGFAGKNAPYGYRNAWFGEGKERKREIVIDPQKAKIVQEIFLRYSRKESIMSIVKWLNDSGERTTRGNLWSIDSVRIVLHNPFYKGLLIFNTKSSRGKMNPYNEVLRVEKPELTIIDPDLWEKCQRRRNKPENRLRRGKLRGIIECGDCGHPISYSERGKNEKVKKYNLDAGGYYYCSWCKRHTGNSKAFGAKQFESKIVHFIETIFRKIEDNIEEFTEHLNLLLEERSNSEDIRELEGVLIDLNQKIENITRAIEEGKGISSLLDRLSDLESRKDQAIKRLKEARTLRQSLKMFTTGEIAELLTSFRESLDRDILSKLISTAKVNWELRTVEIEVLGQFQVVAV